MQDDRDAPVDPQGTAADPEAPPRSDELRAARALRDSLRETEESPDSDDGSALRASNRRDPEARWLAAHLRFPTELESLGELRGRGLARAAREVVMAKRSQAEQRSSTLRRLGRSITGTGGLLLAAAVLLVFSWALLDQGSKLRQSPLGGELSQTAWLLRQSLHRRESPTERLDLLLKERLHHRRTHGLRHGVTLVNRHHRISPSLAMTPGGHLP